MNCRLQVYVGEEIMAMIEALHAHYIANDIDLKTTEIVRAAIRSMHNTIIKEQK